MIVVPLLNNLRVKNYGLFPGADGSHDVTVDFSKGLSLIVGINGLGKTTLLNMLLRSLTGPFDITGYGAPSGYDAVLPENPIRLRKEIRDFFSQRVADGAQNAISTLNLDFKGTQIIISRKLSTLELTNFCISDETIALPSTENEREQLFQKKITDLFNLSSFVDVLLVLHNLVFFTERKAGALWDSNAQRHVLGALFLNKELSKSIAETARSMQSADSQFRNTRSQHTKFSNQLINAQALETSSPDTKAELEATGMALSGLAEQVEQLETKLGDDDDERHQKRLILEKAKLENESANGAVERAKYSSLIHLFPKMEDSARLLISRILSESECLVCGAEASKKKAELESLLLKGFCPACGSAPDSQELKAPAADFEKAKMKQSTKAAKIAGEELAKATREHSEAKLEYEGSLAKVLFLKSEINDLKSKNNKLESLLPTDSERVKNLKRTVAGIQEEMNSERSQFVEARSAYSKELEKARSEIVASAEDLSQKFSGYIKDLLAENAELTQENAPTKIGQTGEKFKFPTFTPEMAAADRLGLTPRKRHDDVSESQRELIDLAFRLALIEVVTEEGHATFVMETPEASLDGLAMMRVGKALQKFSNREFSRLIVTNNLTNAGMITALFGGIAPLEKDQDARFEMIFNLLTEAAPNQAVLDNLNSYQLLLAESVSGVLPQ